MNYAELHLNDWAEATAHLSFIEDAAYFRLIRKVYATESPLPVDVAQIQRLVAAKTREEKAAVESVLREFFALEADGWHNKRCDLELQRFYEKRQKATASAKARWDAPAVASERNANAMRTHSERIANAMPTQCEGNALQSPVASNHIKNSETPPAATPETAPPAAAPRAKKGSRIPPDFAPDAQASLRQIHDLDITRELARFADYWQGKAGQAGVKADWQATWRNWLRTCLETGRYAKRGHSNPDNPHAHLEMR